MTLGIPIPQEWRSEARSFHARILHRVRGQVQRGPEHLHPTQEKASEHSFCEAVLRDLGNSKQTLFQSANPLDSITGPCQHTLNLLSNVKSQTSAKLTVYTINRV